VVSSLRGINDAKLTVDQLREAVRKNKEDGADMIKVFVWTGSLQNGGGRQTLFNEEIAAVCDESKKLGLRTLVHVMAMRPGALSPEGAVHPARSLIP
jgi:hypothetical protein